MGKRRSPMLQKVSNLIKISIFIAKIRLIHLKNSTKFSAFKPLKHYNNYGFLQERQFSPSSTPLISFRRGKMKGSSFYSVRFLSCFNGRHHGAGLDDDYSMESAIVEVDKDCLELSYGFEEEDDDNSVDERAERFIERFYEEIQRQRRESLSSSLNNLPLNRMLKY
ncbi:hypothetical protein SSX86_028881 [Deinandra increscens subsp. villosa]|uniref:Cotton fiber protein n=1 Tax=Deinandra increscens subsp. villosa TaxID=3103831 RepID=A0AAP0CF27_9ASTR